MLDDKEFDENSESGISSKSRQSVLAAPMPMIQKDQIVDKDQQIVLDGKYARFTLKMDKLIPHLDYSQIKPQQRNHYAMLKSVLPNITMRPLYNSELIFANEFERRYYTPKNYAKYQQSLYDADQNYEMEMFNEGKENSYS